MKNMRKIQTIQRLHICFVTANLTNLYNLCTYILSIFRVRFGWTERPTSHRQTYRHPMACFTIQTACSYRWNEMKSCRASVVMKTQPRRNRYILDLSQYVTWFSLLADHVIEIKYYQILWFKIHNLDNREWMCYTHSLTCFDA